MAINATARALGALFVALPFAASTAAVATPMAAVSMERLTHADKEAEQWMSVGRTYDEQRFSPLRQINKSNVTNLGLAWFADFDSNRGQEATPLAIDGVLYVSTAWSKVKAYEARTGRLLWSYDPKVPGEFAGRGCCDVVNRGLAAWNGRIYVASYDGRLIALDANTGAVLWEVLTVDHDKPLTITGAPRIVQGRVLIGNSGGEFGVRGYISAYDAENGRLLWRFYTIPGDPTAGFENAVMKDAARSWHGRWWDIGGGGAVWDGIAYDPKLNLVYFGTGNGTPWNRGYRGSGGGDNLFVASILALHADTGTYAWHYQEVPGEEWDYDATSPLMLADLQIGGKPRRVLMQAGKDGFFYVLDARTGKLLSAKNFVTTTWATAVDSKTGRPSFDPGARYEQTGKPFIIQPGAQGAHSWHPFSYNPNTGLVYFSAIETSMAVKGASHFVAHPMSANIGLEFPLPPSVYDELKSKAPRSAQSQLVAWDPVEQRETWRSPVLGTIGGGTLSTAGGLVFQGTNKDRFVAYDAANGKELWSIQTQTGVVAAPCSFELDGQQYIAEEVGYGLAPYGISNQSRLLVFKLGGSASLPPAPPPPPPPVLDPPPSTAAAQTIEAGHQQFVSHCAMCHEPPAANRAVFPDLRYSPALNSEQAFAAIVLEGALQSAGMASFKDRMSAADIEAVRAYLIERANQAKKSTAAAFPGR
jgi:alcohol dehydrogenase (cytochrome c)/quinohemoprotein ethanol dehydrogenase